MIAIIGIPDNRYHTNATRCQFWEFHCQITHYIFLCGKRNNNS
ncbi:hypothetical protein ACMSF4_21320 [Bacteroides thetaiotaomicron]